MKRILFLSLFLLPLICSAQQFPPDIHRIEYDGVVADRDIVPTIPAEDVWQTVFNTTIKLVQESGKTFDGTTDINEHYSFKIRSTPLHRYQGNNWFTTADIRVEIWLSDSKVRIRTSCGRIEVNGTSAFSTSVSYDPTKAAPVAEKHDAFKLCIPKKAAIATYEALIPALNRVLNTYHQELVK